MHQGTRTAAAAIALSVASAVHAQTHIYVDDDAPPGGNGLSWDSALSDLQEAIDLAESLGASRGEIRVAGGTYVKNNFAGIRIEPTNADYPPISLQGGYAGLALPGAPDTRDLSLYKSVLDGDTNGDDGSGLTADNVPLLLRINDDAFRTGTPVSAAVLCGLTFRGGLDRAVWTSRGKSLISFEQCVFDAAAHADRPIHLEEDTAFFDRCEFRNNRSGTIYADDSEVSISQCHFADNSGGTAGHGGAIYSYDSKLILQQSTLENNLSLTNGGAVYARYGTAHISDCVFLRNVAESGGASYFDVGELEIESSSFQQNVASNGGAVYTRSDLNSLVDLDCRLNTAIDSGGAIFASEDINLQQSSFMYNTAHEGGAAYMRGAVVDCEFSLNTAQDGSVMRNTNRGGAISIAGNTLIQSSQFDQNAAGYGGAVWADPGLSHLAVEDSVFDANMAANRGGAVYGAEHISGASFMGNHTAGGGGAIYSANHVSSSSFKHNSAHQGGASYGSSEIVSCLFESNDASLGGAAYSSVPMVLNDSILFNNTGISASAVYAQASTDIVRSTITQSDPWAYVPLIAAIDSVVWVESSTIWDKRLPGFPVAEIKSGAALGLLYSNIDTDLVTIWDHLGAELVLLGGNIARDPLFVSIEEGDLRLQSGSPCIDAGLLQLQSDLPPTDAMGNDRVVLDDLGTPDSGFGAMSYLDIGAVEFQGTTCLADTNRDGTLAPNDFTAWIAAYNSRDPIADQNRDGFIDPGDYTAWINNYVTGCP
ncbi:MAG: hypothetical protein Phyf2KO_24840 [Phycisphaerales bacterium]